MYRLLAISLLAMTFSGCALFEEESDRDPLEIHEFREYLNRTDRHVNRGAEYQIRRYYSNKFPRRGRW